MRTIKADEELKTLVKVGDIVRLEGFTDDPVMAVVTSGMDGMDCSGCVLDAEESCSVKMRDYTGDPRSISVCCLMTDWMSEKGKPEFGKFKLIDNILENL